MNKTKSIFAMLFLVLVSIGTRAQREVFLPFLDDFSSYTGVPDKNLWEGENCFVNTSYQFLPPSVGVITLDVIDKYGKLYDNASIYTFNADTLSSVKIRLDSLRAPIAKKLSVADSVYLSFFIQPGGGAGQMWERIGTSPSSKDSITVEFYDVENNSWERVWTMRGTDCQTIYNEDSTYYRYVMIKIEDEKFFNKDFRFRFMTYSTLDNNPSLQYISNCDEWNIDYVYLDYNRTFEGNTYRDIAFVNPAHSFLKKYQAMPFNQYRPNEMKDSLDMKIINLYSDALSSHYEYMVEDSNQNLIGSYDGGFENIYPYSTTKEYQTSANHAKPPVAFSYPLMNKPTTYTCTHIVKEGVGNDNIHFNDTVRFSQKFANYFAYDDGTAENGFGVEPIKNSNLAVGYFLNQRDTIYAVDIYFNHTYQNSNIKPFYICLWNSTEDSLPKQKIYQTEKLTPVVDSLNKFIRYNLETPQVMDSGEFFVSVEVKNADYLNLGFDQNNDASMYTFSKVANQWNASFNYGSVMMRPCFGYKTIGIESIETEQYSFYPNPASDYISVSAKDSEVTIFDIAGRKLLNSKANSVIDVSGLRNGVYILRINNTNHKLIISR